MEDEEADARAINAQPWEPPPGMVKRQCPHCRYLFAAPSAEPEAVLLCPDCAAAGTRTVLHHDGGTPHPRLLTNESGGMVLAPPPQVLHQASGSEPESCGAT